MSAVELVNDQSPDADHEARFEGPPTLWLRYTAAERALAASLDDLQAEDLSLHLYNTHAVKALQYDQDALKTVQRWQSRKTWYGTSTTWRPREHWTAWPINITDVPRPKETFRKPEEIMTERDSTVRREETWQPRSDLEEQLQAIMLRRAHEQLNDDQAQARRLAVPEDTKPSMQDEGMQDRTITCDDEEACQVLLPSIDHIICQFDQLLTALHKNRKGHQRTFSTAKTEAVSGTLKHEKVGSDDESATAFSWPDSSDSESSQLARKKPSKRPRGRDWSEVLAVAAMVGWDTDVVSAVVDRCSCLFKQSMTLTTLSGPAISYEMQPLALMRDRRTRPKPMTTPSVKNLHCPIDDCKRTGEFESVKRLNEHLRRTHKWTVEQCTQWHDAEKARRICEVSQSVSQEDAADGLANIAHFDFAAYKRRRVDKR